MTYIYGSCGSLHYSTANTSLSWKQRNEVREIAESTTKSVIDRYLKKLPKAFRFIDEIGVVD